MIRIEPVEDRIMLNSQEPVFWCVSCDCGWSEDVGWQSDAEELGREHWTEANCDF